MALPALLDRVRSVDVWFQVNVHCVSVWAMILFLKTTGLIIVAVCVAIICSIPGWLVGLWVVSESDFTTGPPAIGTVLGLIGGIIIVIKGIKPIYWFKRFKRDAKQIKPIKRFKK